MSQVPGRSKGDRIATAIFWLVLGGLGLVFGLGLLISGLEREPLMAVGGGVILVLTVLGLRQGWRIIRGR